MKVVFLRIFSFSANYTTFFIFAKIMKNWNSIEKNSKNSNDSHEEFVYWGKIILFIINNISTPKASVFFANHDGHWPWDLIIKTACRRCEIYKSEGDDFNRHIITIIIRNHQLFNYLKKQLHSTNYMLLIKSPKKIIII